MKEIYVPGQAITTEEEFAPGKNTFVENGEVKAANFGEAEFDNDLKEVSIKSKNLRNLKRDDFVYARVTQVKESMVKVEILNAEDGIILTVTRGQIPVKFVSKAYVSNAKELFKMGDYLKAKVISANDLAVDLATNEKGLGVVTAYCSNCKKAMNFSNDRMTCFECGNSEKRKWFAQEDEMSPRSFDRNDRGFNRRGFDRGRSFGSRDGHRNNNSRNGFHKRNDRNNNFSKQNNHRRN